MKAHSANGNDDQRKARIEELKQKIRDATGENPIFGTMNDCPPEVEEAFLRNVLAFETAIEKPLLAVLLESGLKLPPPADLSDAELSDKLWEVIHALIAMKVSVGNTDHLSDRELYTTLCNETLKEEFRIGTGYTINIDMTETENYEEGLRTYLKYYASEEERSMYARMYPDLQMPRHCEPPNRRDHLIP
jgi:hypothetical protein